MDDQKTAPFPEKDVKQTASAIEEALAFIQDAKRDHDLEPSEIWSMAPDVMDALGLARDHAHYLEHMGEIKLVLDRNIVARIQAESWKKTPHSSDLFQGKLINFAGIPIMEIRGVPRRT
jgi:hypothetical protein